MPGPTRADGVAACLAALALAVAPGLAACGGDDDASSGGGANVETAAPPAGSAQDGDRHAGPPTGRDDEPERVPNPPPPGTIGADGPSLERLVNKVLGDVTVDGGRRVVSAGCTGGRCRIVYVSDIPGEGKILEDQRGMWAKLFSNPEIERVTMAVRSGPKDAPGGGKETPRGLTITCDRSADRELEWERAQAVDLTSACDVR